MKLIYLIASLFFVTLSSCELVDVGIFQQGLEGVAGRVFLVDTKTIMIKDFSYSGNGPAILFWAGTGTRDNLNSSYFVIPDQKCSNGAVGGKLSSYKSQTILLTLPVGRTVSEMNSFDVWCSDVSVSFGYVSITSQHKSQIAKVTSDFSCSTRPAGAVVDLGSFQQVDHGVSGKVMIVDSKTLKLVDFTYDGLGPAGLFWAGTSSDRQSLKTNYAVVPDEKCQNTKINDKLPAYKKKTFTLTLPPGVTVYDLKYFDVWCADVSVSFGYVAITEDAKAKMVLKTEEAPCSPQQDDDSNSGADITNVSQLAVLMSVLFMLLI